MPRGQKKWNNIKQKQYCDKFSKKTLKVIHIQKKELMKKRKKIFAGWSWLVSKLVNMSKLGGSIETRNGSSLKMPRTSTLTHPRPGSAQREPGRASKDEEHSLIVFFFFHYKITSAFCKKITIDISLWNRKSPHSAPRSQHLFTVCCRSFQAFLFIHKQR